MIEETIDRALRGGDIGLDGVTELMSTASVPGAIWASMPFSPSST